MNIYEENNTCVCCGEIIPEGYQYCRSCYEDKEQMEAISEICKNYKHKKEAIINKFRKLLRFGYEDRNVKI